MKQGIYLTIFLFVLLPKISLSQKDTVQARVVLIGDAGDFQGGKHPVINAVRSRIKLDAKTTVVYLGDNLYMTGLPDESYASYDKRRAVLDTQAFIARNTPAKVIFIPGNHDWNRGHKGGYDYIMRQQLYINNLGEPNVRFYPEDACPGPVEVPLSDDAVLVVMDSQWWIHQYEKPGIESECDYKTPAEVLNHLDDILSHNSRRLVILATHHPFKSYGVHGGYFRPKQWIFPLTEMYPKLYVPLPGIGFVYPIARKFFGTPQDIPHPYYQDMIKRVQEVVKKYPNVVFVAGHEHNLQLIKDSSYNYIVSGSGTKKTRVSTGKNRLFGAQENGFATLEVSTNKNVRVDFYTVKGDSSENAYTANLLDFSKLPKELTDSLNVKSEAVEFRDSALVAVNKKYDSVSGFHRIFLGNNYRKEWATPVNLKVLNLRKEKGGLTIQSLGGGKQTQTLRLKDKSGKEWVLRSINKDPQGALPENFRNSVAQHVVQDMISASHPYGALAIPDLAKAANIVVASPSYYYVPDDPALEYYRDLFANTVCALEEREPSPDNTDTRSTAKVMSKLYEDNDNRVDQKAMLTARLLDILIGDWDRHFDQWRFGIRDTGKGKIYYPIPRDRDQVFFKGEGLLIKGVSTNLLPYLKGFEKDIKKINWFNWGARDFDRIFLNQLSKEDWIQITEEFKRNITDAVISTAVRKLPPNIYALNGQVIIDKLKSRRDNLTAEALKYYNFLSREVNIVGSNKKEYFKVMGKGKDIQVSVFKRTKNNDTSALMYNRVFSPKTTEEIRLFGLSDDDVFEVDDQAKANIRVRLIGGNGNDTFNVKGDIHNDIYDLTTQKNHIIQKNHSRIKTSENPEVNRYEPLGYRYNIYRFPRLNLGYNIDDRLMAGVGVLYRTYRFRKEPYSTQQRLTTLYAFHRKSYQVRYQAEINQVIGRTDLVLNTEIVNPVLNNFFGFGNETTIKEGRDLEYYRVRYKYTQGELLFRNRPFNVLSIAAGPTWYHYWNEYEDNKHRILGAPSLVGLDSLSVYSKKTYYGAKFHILINNLNSDLLPTRGIYWNTDFTALRGAGSTNHYTRLTSDMTLYSSFSEPSGLVFVTRVGGGRIYSKDYQYFQALTLGSNNFLRGFRKNRFAGDALFYSGLEVRLKLFNSKSFVLPGSVGLLGFGEVGRVWLRNEESRKWHDSYGGGLYYAAFNVALFSATMGFSREEKTFNFSVGSKFNITF